MDRTVSVVVVTATTTSVATTVITIIIIIIINPVVCYGIVFGYFSFLWFNSFSSFAVGYRVYYYNIIIVSDILHDILCSFMKIFQYSFRIIQTYSLLYSHYTCVCIVRIPSIIIRQLRQHQFTRCTCIPTVEWHNIMYYKYLDNMNIFSSRETVREKVPLGTY